MNWNREMKMVAWCCLAITVLGSNAAGAAEQVSIASLLKDMSDRDVVARYPKKNFRLKQASSYNRASKTPEEPKGWFTNKDYNSKPGDHNFIRIEENNGQQEWVLMDHTGSGAIVRTWMPWHNPKTGGSDVTLRIYLDGASEPVLEGNMLGMFDGSGLIPYPFAHPSLRSAVNFFPIPYAKSCKVTTTAQPFFYQFTFREYDESTPVKTFKMEDFEAAQGLIKKTGETLLNPMAIGGGDLLRLSARLGSHEEKSLKLPAGTAAVRELSVKLGSYADPNVTRQVVLKIEFDDKETVWCPIGDFFGSGIGLNPVQGWYRTVAKDGTMSCRWVMPYQKGGKVSLINLRSKPVDAELVVKTGKWTWDDRSMYFHAAWRGQYPVPTRPHSDWNYVTINGRGVYVGDTLTIMNPVANWWGEGDEKIWVDGEDFPSIFGTGTEDYYAYSWGGRSTDFYEHPFHAQPRAHSYNKLNRKTSKERNTLGYSTETRSRALDTMPFGSSLQLDMEVWHWDDCKMGYGVGAYWYGFADTTSNRKPEPVEVLNVPPIPNTDTAPHAKTPRTSDNTADRPPNFVVIFADDLGYGDISCYDPKGVATPHIDSLATDGYRSTDFFVPANVCSPSRAAMLTGRYPMRCGIPVARHEAPGSKYENYGLVPDEITIPELLKPAGYRSLMVGKWHLGMQVEGSHPIDAGFDEYLGIPSNYAKNSKLRGPNADTLYRGKAIEKKNVACEELTQRYTDEVVDFIGEQQDNPFFIYVAHHIVHSPHLPSKDFIGASKKGKYGDFIKELDHSTGRIMKALRDAGVDDNTLVVFTSDNGPTFHGSAGVLRGGKYNTIEGGHRVPGIFRWPGVIPAGQVDGATLSSMDLLPLFCGLAGVKIPSDRKIDGKNILSVLEGETSASPHKRLYYYNGANLQAVREGDWKLHLPRTEKDQPFWSKKNHRHRVFVTLDQPRLYNLKEDVGEKRDLADQHPGIVTRLQQVAAEVRAELGDVHTTGSDQRRINLVDPQER